MVMKENQLFQQGLRGCLISVLSVALAISAMTVSTNYHYSQHVDCRGMLGAGFPFLFICDDWGGGSPTGSWGKIDLVDVVNGGIQPEGFFVDFLFYILLISIIWVVASRFLQQGLHRSDLWWTMLIILGFVFGILLAVFGNRRTGEQGRELAMREICPRDGCGLVCNIRGIDAQIAGDLKVTTKPVVDPGVVTTPDLVQDIDDIFETFPRIDPPDICRDWLMWNRGGVPYIKDHHSRGIIIRGEPMGEELIFQVRQQIVIVHLPGERLLQGQKVVQLLVNHMMKPGFVREREGYKVHAGCFADKTHHIICDLLARFGIADPKPQVFVIAY